MTGGAVEQDRWVLLHHHHWLLEHIGDDGVLVPAYSANFSPGTSAARGAGYADPERHRHEMIPPAGTVGELEEIAEGPEDQLDHNVHYDVDDEGALPLYHYPPADGSSCFDELPIETIMHIFSFLNACSFTAIWSCYRVLLF